MADPDPSVTQDAFPIEPPGVWIELRSPPGKAHRPALFLDRDGVVIEDADYIRDPDAVRLMPGTADLIAGANRAGIPVAIVSNQSGIARGIYGWAEFAAVENEMMRLLNETGASIDAVTACPFHADYTADFDSDMAQWNKPGPRMIETICERLDLDARRSWMIGDKATDVAAAKAAGLAGAIHVLTGHGEEHRAEALALASADFPVIAADAPEDSRGVLADRLGIEAAH